jgi:hypothetical protein
MYPYAPAPHVPSAAEKHVSANTVLMLVMTFLHLCGIGSAVMNIALFFREHPSSYGRSPFERGELLGQMIAFVGALLWAVSGLVWAPLNAWALSTRKRWARTSSLLYWGVQCVSCCCFPFGAYGLWSLLRADVKALFAEGRR